MPPWVVLGLAGQMESCLRGLKQVDALDRLKLDLDNIRAALDFDEPEDAVVGLRIACALQALPAWRSTTSPLGGDGWERALLVLGCRRRADDQLTTCDQDRPRWRPKSRETAPPDEA